MSRKRQLDALGVQRVKDARKAGDTIREIADREGCSVGVVSKAERGAYDDPPVSSAKTGATPKRRRVGAPRPASSTGDASAPKEPKEPRGPVAPMTDDELRETLRQTAALLAQRIADADGDDNVAELHGAVTRMNQTVAQIAKMTPEEPPDPNSSPDMVAAAKRCRRKHHELMTKLLEERRAKEETE